MGRNSGRLQPKINHPEFTLAAAAAGIGEVAPEATEVFEKWIEDGKHAGMTYMENNMKLRRNPATLLEGAKTIIVCAIPFPLSRTPGPIASYALGKDYHDVIRKLFKPSLRHLREGQGGEWRLCVDSAPLMERYWAEKSGLGRRTLSGMIAVRGMGTGCFIFEILTTLGMRELGIEAGILTSDEFEDIFGFATSLPEGSTEAECPGETCGACVKSCPGKALNEGETDSRRCLSYLTIEHREAWRDMEALETMATPEGRATLFGCDRCLLSCPLNRMPYRPAAELLYLPGFMPREEIVGIKAEDVAGMTDKEFGEIFAGTAIKRARPEGMRRNAMGIRD